MPKINRLTPKMEKFCECIVSGMPYKEAYIKAYNTENMSNQVILNESRKLMMRDDITERINQLRKPLLNHEQNVVISERERIKANLWEMINNPDTKDENRLRAMDILNRMNQEYINTTIDNNNKDELTDVDSNQLLELIKAV